MSEYELREQKVRAKLPLDLGDGLLLRWGAPADADELGAFNVAIHTDNPEEPETWLADYTADLMGGQHPTTQASDFTVVVDRRAGDRIVSSLNLISQTWTFAGIPFGVGRVELVGTDPKYRRRGLVRKQMEAIHSLSAARGELAQAITGIPWYYRQFGYEMTVNMGGSRDLFWIRAHNDKPLADEIYQMRPAKKGDIVTLEVLTTEHSSNSLVLHQRNRAIWEYELFSATRGTAGAREVYMIEDRAGAAIAYVQVYPRGGAYRVRELGVAKGHSWRAVCLFVVRELKKRAAELNEKRARQITRIKFELGEVHPAYDALGAQLEKPQKPYAWYIRVPNIEAFLRHIIPVLEQRLRESVMAGHTGTLRLNLYHSAFILTIEKGKVREISAYELKEYFDADAFFPDLSFLQLLFGYRDFTQLDGAMADCFVEHPQAAVLLDCLFPRQPSDVNPLS